MPETPIDWVAVVRRRVAGLPLTASAESSLVEELAQHLDDLHRELRRAGFEANAAYQKTLTELDDLATLRGGLSQSQREPARPAATPGAPPSPSYLDDLRGDLRYAWRTMVVHRWFALFVVITLGLGIGANTTVFTVINTLIMNPMPVAEPDTIVAVAAAEPGGAATGALLPFSAPNFVDYQTGVRAFDSLAGYTRMRPVTWRAEGASQPLLSELVTANYFSTLGVRAAAGRMFGAEVDASRTPAVAVMNYGTWRSRFGGAPDVVGRQLQLNGVTVTVIGVTPSGFIGVNGLVGPDLWLPFGLGEQLQPGEWQASVSDRAKAMLQGVARLRRGVTIAQARAQVAAAASALAREYPDLNAAQTATVRPIGDALFGSRAAMMRFAGVVLAIVVGAVLVIACSNVANLLLARAAARRQELAVRVALGASRGRLMRQLLTESLVLALASGAVGVAIAYGGIQLLAKTLPATGTFVAARLDGAVLLFALGVSMATGLLFGAGPALAASRTTVTAAFGESRIAGPGGRRVTVANALLAGQVALSFLLLMTAALCLRSIQRAYEIDPGFETRRLAIFMTNPGQAGLDAPRQRAFYRDTRTRVAALPGVESVSWASNMPLFARPLAGLVVEGRTPGQADDRSTTTIVNTVDVGYFDTAGVTLSAGRGFGEIDGAASLPVAIVNEKLARDFWPGGDAIGKRLQAPGERRLRTIVGVARNAHYTAWGETPQRCVYLPLEQNESTSMTLYVRTTGEPGVLVNAVGRELASVGPQVLVSGVRTAEQVIGGALFQARIGVWLLSIFGLLALGLAGIGLYGLLSYAVHERRREIGVRMALGASRWSVLRLMLRQGLTLVLVGVSVGFAGVWVVGRLLNRMLYGVSPADPTSLAAAAVVLGLVALGACYLPARRASRLDPIRCMRE
jgi:predicted permease